MILWGNEIVLIKMRVGFFLYSSSGENVDELTVPIFIGWFCSKIVIFQHFLFPTRTVNQLRKGKRKI